MGLDFWRNLAIVWLALLCFIGMLIPLAAALFAVKGMHVAVAKTPGLFHLAQDKTQLARTKVDSASRTVADQVIRTRSRASGFQTHLTRLAGDASSRPERKGPSHE